MVEDNNDSAKSKNFYIFLEVKIAPLQDFAPKYALGNDPIV